MSLSPFHNCYCSYPIVEGWKVVVRGEYLSWFIGTKSRGFISKPLGKTVHHRDQHDQSRVNKVESNRKQDDNGVKGVWCQSHKAPFFS